MKGVFLNVNIPAQPKDRIRGVLVTPQDMRPAAEIYEKRETRDGQALYWATYKPLDSDGKKTDVWAVHGGYISITPMTGNQTAASAVAGLRRLEEIVW